MNDRAVDGPTIPIALAPVQCPGCGADDAEPVAVGEDFELGTAADSLLALRCRNCELVYLNPAPMPIARDRLYPPAYFTKTGQTIDRRRNTRAAVRAALAHCRNLPAAPRVLELAYGDTVHVGLFHRTVPTWTLDVLTPHLALAAVARQGGFETHVGFAADLPENRPGYDAILVLHSLEHCSSPVDELQRLRPLLAPGGRVVIVAHNADSAVARAFRGRHWAGYDFPRHPVLFGPASLRRLAERAGYHLELLRGVHFARTWARSASAFLSDWGAPSWMRGRSRPGDLMTAALGTAAEATLGRGARAAWMACVLVPRSERPQ